MINKKNVYSLKESIIPFISWPQTYQANDLDLLLSQVPICISAGQLLPLWMFWLGDCQNPALCLRCISLNATRPPLRKELFVKLTCEYLHNHRNAHLLVRHLGVFLNKRVNHARLPYPVLVLVESYSQARIASYYSTTRRSLLLEGRGEYFIWFGPCRQYVGCTIMAWRSLGCLYDDRSIFYP